MVHYDLYPEFELYGYKVSSNKSEPGFIYLDGVGKKGFGLATLKWLPDGPALNKIKINLTTAPLYKPNTSYHFIRYEKDNKKITGDKITSDAEGKIQFISDEKDYEIGIYLPGDGADFKPVGFMIGKNRRYLRVGEANDLSLQILNRGEQLNERRKITVALTSLDSTVTVENETMSAELKPGQPVTGISPFRISARKSAPANAAPPWVKFKVAVTLDSSKSEDEIMVPVFFEVPVGDAFTIDDGRKINDTTTVYGKGNGDGVVSKGESIMIYVDGYRTRLYSDDPFVQTGMETLVDEALPAKWPDGYTLTSVVRIDPRCPDGHMIEFLANYETKGFMPIDRRVTWRKISVKVRN
jgi:hypothetical protein